MRKFKNMPVLVGIGQLTNRTKNPDSPGDPLKFMAECAKIAAEDASSPDILREIDSLVIIRIMSREYSSELKQFVEMLGANPADFAYTPTGATSPQVLTSRLCNRIANGKSEIGLVCGAEAFYSGGSPDWAKLTSPNYDNFPFPLVGDTMSHASDLERRYGLHVPSVVYPVFANAFRKSQGLGMDEYIIETGKLCAKLSEKTRTNEYAWFKEPKSASFISTVTPENRIICYPFTKYMNAIMNVDQAAVLLIMSEKKPTALGSRKRKEYIGSNGSSLIMLFHPG